MRQKDRQLGTPYIQYVGIKSQIEALTGLSTGALAVASDAQSAPLGVLVSGTWVWSGAGISGSGTQFYLPVWTGGASLGTLASLGSAGAVLQSAGAGANPAWSSFLFVGTAAQTYTFPSGSATLPGLALANIFTTSQTINPATDVIGLTIKQPASPTVNAFVITNSSGSVSGGFDKYGRVFCYGNPAVTSNFFAHGGGNATLTGTNNLCIGGGINLTEGSRNFLLGSQAGDSLTIETDNFFLGNQCGLFIQGVGNVSVGTNSMRGASLSSEVSSCVAIGKQSGFSLRTGADSNTFAGANSGYSVTTGARGIYLGYGAGFYQTTTDDLLIIGNRIFASAAQEVTNSIIYGVMAATPASQTLRLNAVTTITQIVAATNTITNAGIIRVESTGTVANSFGGGLLWQLETATADTIQSASLISASWVDATNATRKAKLSLSAYDTSIRTGLEIEATGSDVTLRTLGKVSFTQTDDNEYIDSLNDGYLDYRVTTAHRFGDGTNQTSISGTGRYTHAGTARKTWTKYTANSVTLTAGTSASSVTDLQTMTDGNYYTLTEAAATPGQDLIIDFVSVTAFEQVRLLLGYNGVGSHAIALQIYNWSSAAWDTFNDLQNGTYQTTAGAVILHNASFRVYDDTNYIGTGGNSGQVRIRIYHPMAGNSSHTTIIDEVSLRQ